MGAAHYYYPELFSVLKGTCAFPFPVHSFSTLYEYTPAKYVPLMISFHSETTQFPYRSMFLVVYFWFFWWCLVFFPSSSQFLNWCGDKVRAKHLGGQRTTQ